jgi:hypothetical protein
MPYNPVDHDVSVERTVYIFMVQEWLTHGLILDSEPVGRKHFRNVGVKSYLTTCCHTLEDSTLQTCGSLPDLIFGFETETAFPSEG